MKNEPSWKRKFFKKKLKYTLLTVFVVAIIFFIHQLFYYKELNQATIGKLISGSAQGPHISAGSQSKWNKPQHSKLIRDKDGRTVSLRGTRDQDISKYFPNKQGKFVCFPSNKEIDFPKINDNYCDCILDGSDEPGTNACNNAVFYCETSSKKFPVKISSYKVNDGYCDCCDGSDEWDDATILNILNVTNVKEHTAHALVNCQNKC